MEEEEDEKHSEPACPWEAAHTAAAFVTSDPMLRLRLLLHRQVMLSGQQLVDFKMRSWCFTS